MGIRTIRHKGLEELFTTGKSRYVKPALQKHALRILDRLRAMTDLKDCQGVRDFHPLKGNRAGTYAMSVSGNYRITFKWDGRDAYDVNLEDYH